MALKNLKNVLDILKETQDEDVIDEHTFHETDPDAQIKSGRIEPGVVVTADSRKSISKSYNVLYGKPSTRKHKTWDLDGVLKVENNVVSLMDADGLRIGQSKIDNENLMCDSEIYIGGKCVKIVEELSGNDSVQVQATQSQVSRVSSLTVPNKAPSALGSSKLSRGYILSKKSLLRPLSVPVLPADPSSAAPSSSSVGNGPISSVSKIPLASAVSRKRPLEESSAEAIQSNQLAVMTPKRIFNVVYGKPSGKKHKSWENDGTLEVTTDGSIVMLKDVQGKVVETKSKIADISKYESGFETFVGGKCVQILDEITGTSSTNSSDGNNSASTDKKPTKAEVGGDYQLPWRPAKKSRYSLHSNQDENALILPKPIVDHQWKHNPSSRPLVDVKVEPFLSRVLKPHQREGVSFLYERVCDLGNLDLEGAILADEMGLGKTLQCIALIWTLLRQGPYGVPVIRKVLIVTPSSLTSNWNNEFKKWLGLTRICPFHVDKKNKPEDYVYSRVSPVFIISYDMLIRAYQTIVNTEFDVMICDEGHRLKNGKSKLYELMAGLNIRKRVLLSGTPLQNDLQEFFYLNDFANPGVLGSLREFKRNFEEPILESRNPNCSHSQQELGELRSFQLAKRTQWFILRRTSDVQAASLSIKRETLLVCRASRLQGALYQRSVEYWDARGSKDSHLSMMHALRKICNHPGLVQTEDDGDDETDQGDLKSFLSQEWCRLSGNEVSTAQSGKLLLVEALLRDLRAKAEEKIVIVSYFTLTLDLFEVLCKEIDYSYLRLDGSTNVQSRQPIVDQFNDPKSSVFVLLLSARAGGAGLNLIGASRLILYDSDWNPATDLQAMARIWRHGQKKPVHIYRLLTAGTVEEKIFQRQISKVDLTDSVMDAHVSNETATKMSPEELKDLFTFEPHTPSYIHSSLQCHCPGQGEVPGERQGGEETVEEEEEDSEESFLECLKKKAKDKEGEGKRNKNRQHMLMSWAHYQGDQLSEEILKMVALPQDAPMISYMFTRSTELT